MLCRCAAAQRAGLHINHPPSFLEGGFHFQKQLQVLVASLGTWRFLTSCSAAGIPKLSAGFGGEVGEAGSFPSLVSTQTSVSWHSIPLPACRPGLQSPARAAAVGAA